MFERLKYELLVWLLNEICERSECKHCRLCRNGGCYMGDTYGQARRVWGLEVSE
jgi:hypothetical protein